MKHLQQLFQKISTAIMVLLIGALFVAPMSASAIWGINPFHGGSGSGNGSSSGGSGGSGSGSGSGGGSGSVSTAASGSQDAICSGIGLTGANCSDNSGSKGVAGLAASIINILSIVGGIIAVIMIVVGGFRYVISGGDSNATAGARSTIVYALVGLLVIAVAQLVVQFVLKKLSNS